MSVLVKGLVVAAGSAALLAAVLTAGVVDDAVAADVLSGAVSAPVPASAGDMALWVERLAAQEMALLDYRQEELSAWMEVNMAKGFVPGNYPAAWHEKIVKDWGEAIRLIEEHRALVLRANAEQLDNGAACDEALASYHGAPLGKLKGSYEEFVELPERIAANPYTPVAAPAGAREVASILHMAYITCSVER